MALIALNVVVYVITAPQGGGINLPGGQLFADWALQGNAVSNGDWWRLVTAMFLHGSILHLGFNMLALYWLGTIIEQALGTPRFLLVYFVSGSPARPARSGSARSSRSPSVRRERSSASSAHS